MPHDSVLVGNSIRDAHIRDHTGALVLALREPDGSFVTNPAPDQVLSGGQILIAMERGPSSLRSKHLLSASPSSSSPKLTR